MQKNGALLIAATLLGILTCGGAIFLIINDKEQTTKTSESENTISQENTQEGLENLTFEYEGLALGTSIKNELDPNVLMSDVIRLDDGSYRMYYNAGSKGAGMIKYAESEDGLSNWTVKGVALYGGSQPEDDDYVIGGSRVIHLQDGTWRMYYRATPDIDEKTQPPSYSIYVATSTDGETFTKQSVVIANDREDPKSNFTLAGHGAFYQLENGTFAGFFSGNTKDQTTHPSDLFFTTSEDGLTWNEPVRMYIGVHDPAVVTTEDGYMVIAMNMKESVGIAFSSNGTTWPEEMQEFSILDAQEKEINLQYIGDLSINLAEDGSLLLYSNYAVGSERGIAEYTEEK